MRAWSYALMGAFGAGEFLLVLCVWLAYGQPDLGTMVQVSVAVGTGSLSVAAIVSIAFDLSKREEDSKPHIEIYQRNVTVTKAEIAGRPSFTSPTPYETHRLVLRNNGPGVAANLFARVHYIQTVPIVARTSEDQAKPLESPEFLSEEVEDEPLDRRYLASGEEIEIAAPDSWLPAFDPTTKDAIAFHFAVSATDLDGRKVLSAFGGLRRHPERLGNQGDADEARGEFNYYLTHSRWEWIDDFEALRTRVRKPRTGDPDWEDSI